MVRSDGRQTGAEQIAVGGRSLQGVIRFGAKQTGSGRTDRTRGMAARRWRGIENGDDRRDGWRWWRRGHAAKAEQTGGGEGRRETGADDR